MCVCVISSLFLISFLFWPRAVEKPLRLFNVPCPLPYRIIWLCSILVQWQWQWFLCYFCVGNVANNTQKTFHRPELFQTRHPTIDCQHINPLSLSASDLEVLLIARDKGFTCIKGWWYSVAWDGTALFWFAQSNQWTTLLKYLIMLWPPDLASVFSETVPTRPLYISLRKGGGAMVTCLLNFCLFGVNSSRTVKATDF